MWSVLRNIPKFTTKASIDTIIGDPKFQLEDRPAYYYGSGIVVYYSAMCFRIEGITRVEYGEPGEYAVGLYHFSNANYLKECLNLKSFNETDVIRFNEDIIEGAITYDSTFMDVHNWAISKGLYDYQEGETQGLVDGEIKFLNSFIQYKQYELYFYGKSKKTKISGFRFAFNE